MILLGAGSDARYFNHHRHRRDPRAGLGRPRRPGRLPAVEPFIRSASGKLAERARLTLRLVPAEGGAMTVRPAVLAAAGRVAALDRLAGRARTVSLAPSLWPFGARGGPP